MLQNKTVPDVRGCKIDNHGPQKFLKWPHFDEYYVPIVFIRPYITSNSQNLGSSGIHYTVDLKPPNLR